MHRHPGDSQPARRRSEPRRQLAVGLSLSVSSSNHPFSVPAEGIHHASWPPNSVSTASEWATPFDGENNLPVGLYVYRTTFQVPSVLPGGGVPTGVTINGQLASDNATFGIYLESPANTAKCSPVTGQSFPVNPAGHGAGDFEQWWDFSFTNSLPITPDAAAFLYFVVDNPLGGPSPTGLRVEFFASSTFF
jgi:hypothetical protein